MARRYEVSDSAQQVVGGFLLAGPFVVTEEVWLLASRMTLGHALVTVGVVIAIGYGGLYGADEDRDPDREADIAGIPLRFMSLMAVSFGSVTVLALTLTAPRTFLIYQGILENPTPVLLATTTAKAVSVGAIFSVVGAATADSIF
jgi:uncharacterized membrane protein